MTRTHFTLFSGGDGAGIGLAAAGYTHLGGIEYDSAIAAVAASNGHPLTVADVRAVDPASYAHGAPDWLHASPPCKNASIANADGGEATEDIETAQAVCRFIRAWLPPTFSLENVWGYRTFAAFTAICQTLTECGYSYDYWHLNAANYGVPQTRRRLILVARRGLHRIQRPEATHRDGGDLWAAPWVGWYAAIEDLVPTLPESQFAPWQEARLPKELFETTLLWGIDQNARDVTQCESSRPAPTVTTNTLRRPSSSPIAFILDCQDSGAAHGLTVRRDDEPMYTLSATMWPRRPARAFIVEGTTGGATSTFTLPVRDEEAPVFTIRAAQHKGLPRAWLTTGRVVAMTPRALARFQSFPDSYVLPAKNNLACTVIGNAVPPLLMQRIAESGQ